MDAGTWRGIFTVVMLVLFLGICGWAWSSKRRSVFDAASRLPLEDDETSAKKPDARHDDETER